MELDRIHIANLGKLQHDQDLSIYAEGIVVDFPFAPAEHTSRIEGVEGLSKFLAAIGEFTTGHRVEGVITHLTESGFILRYTESSIFRGTGKNYSSQILWAAEVHQNKITSLTEYYNPLAVLQALGEINL